MRAFFVGLLCLFLWTTIARYIYVCKIKNQCQPIITSFPENDRLKNLRLTDGNAIILDGYEQFAFTEKNTSPSLSADNNRFLDGIANFLENNPDKNLKIMGYYRPSEASLYEGRFENLGLARANRIRELLMKHNIAADRLFLDYDVADESLVTPLGFELFSSIPDDFEETDERLSNAQYSFDNMVFSDANFESNSALFKPGQAFLNWADSVKVFFQINPNKTLTIIGHTDKTGTVQYNKSLGLKRAEAARSFFKSKGLASDIEVVSMGEKQPIATNKTKAGRQKNRRVNFIIK